jgi:hypothetical protein
MKKVEDVVVFSSPCSIGRCSGDDAVDVADETRPPERGLYVDRPLGLVRGIEGENDGGDMVGSAAGGEVTRWGW